jgi:pimeloyl-ACP methyl ester carboxylesterase
MSINRRTLLGAAAGTLIAGPAGAQSMNKLFQRRGMNATEDEPLVLRRPPRKNEDREWYALTQRGPFLPNPKPASIQFGHGRVIVHSPKDYDQGELVVFSHGALSDPMIYRNLLQHWASHGFVVVAPVHDDSIQERGLLTRRATGVGSAVWEVDRILNDVLAWGNRVDQCGIALEHGDLIAKGIGMKIRSERPIIVGHDFGAYVAQIVMGAEVASQGGKPFAPKDDRWFGAIAMSPQGPGIMGLTENSWANCTRPLLAIEAALEQDFTGQAPLDKVACFTRSPPGYKHLAWFEKGPPTIYAGTQSALADTPEDGKMFEDVKAATTAFLIAYGRYDQAMFAKLQSDWPTTGSEGRITARTR